MAVNVQTPPDSMYRSTEGLGVWEHKGKVAAVGIGVSPTARRWDESPETSVGAWTILAIRNAMEDAGVSPEEVDGIVLTPDTSTGVSWPKDRPIPESFVETFNLTDDPLDGIVKLSIEWILKNMPELTNIKFAMHAPTCMSNAIVVGAQAVGDGMTQTCLVVRGWHNLAGRYYVGQGAAGMDTIAGPAGITSGHGVPACGTTAMMFQEYCHKYGKNHDMMANFVITEKRNGLLLPEGYWAQHLSLIHI